MDTSASGWAAAAGTCLLLLAGCRGTTPVAGETVPYGESLPGVPAIGVPEGEAGDPSWTAMARDAVAGPIATAGRAGAAMLDAVTPKARVIPAADPISLSSTVEVGSDLHYRAARVFESQNNMGQAIAHYERALAAAPDDVQVILGLARVYDRQGELNRAESYYQSAAEVEPENATVLNDMGLCLARQWKLEPALANLNRAVQLKPDSQRYRNNLATLLVEMGRDEEAVQVLAAVQGSAVAHYNTAYLLARRGQVEPAKHHLRRSLEANPSFPAARALLAQFDEAPSLPNPEAQTARPMVRRLPQR